MRTSRIAKETSKITQQISPTKASMRPQTRNFAQSLRSYSANGLPITKTEEGVEETKPEIIRDDDSSELSSAGSTFSADMEDLPVPRTDLRKRKRGANTPSIITPSVATSNALTFRRKAGMRAKKQPAKKVTNEDGHVEIYPPPHWEEIYEAVKEMRKKTLAPVDTMGCETLAEEHSSPR
ncbi:MAG: DNA N-glycosylase and apurinic/apyrimidinic (AP) lyase, partial [Pleopsidium flavum]